MRHIFYTIIFLFAAAAAVQAQNQDARIQALEQQFQQLQQLQQLQNPGDTLSYRRAPLADSSLVGTTVFQLIGEKEDVTVSQPAEMEQAYQLYLKSNGEKKRAGYRIRLFFDNKQTARVESEMLEKVFQLQFPQIPTYRSYNNPFFKVVVGDYRTKSDAIRELNRILPFYPKAIVVKESIHFPAI